MSAPVDKPDADPNYILSQEEFHRAINASHAGTNLAIFRQVEGLRTTAGWLFVSLGIWAFLIGVIILTGNEKGRP